MNNLKIADNDIFGLAAQIKMFPINIQKVNKLFLFFSNFLKNWETQGPPGPHCSVGLPSIIFSGAENLLTCN